MPSRLPVVLVSLLLTTSAAIFWLWLVILPARVAKLCPEECWCNPVGCYVDCYNSSLNSIPLILSTDIRRLVLDGNSITSLEKDVFVSRGLTELEVLRANKCEIKTIEFGAFNGLKKMLDMSVSGNEIREITPRTFASMISLEYLDLAHNKLVRLEVDLFCGLVNLKRIHLEGNKLHYLHPNTFVGLPNLQRLYLSNNPGLQIPTDRHFINSRSLKHLHISDCNVSSVSVETFANVSALEWLDPSYNNLRSVDINMLKYLSNLSVIYLGGNPLQCDCQLQEVWRWCQDHNIRTVYEKEVPECDTPSEVKGKWWGVLEKGQCLQDNMYYYGDYINTRYSDTHIEDTDTEKETDTDMDTETKQQAQVSSFLKQYQAALYAVPFIFGTIVNVILIFIIVSNKDLRTVPNMYILNLAISDMIYLTVLFFETCANTISDTWLDGDFMCTFLPFCYRLLVGLSAYTVAMFSIQRHNVAVNMLNFRMSSLPTLRFGVATICGVWIVAALFAIPSAVSNHGCTKRHAYSCITYQRNVVIFELLVSCVFPLCLIAFSYIMTAYHLVKSAPPLLKESQITNNSSYIIGPTVLALTVVFAISYVPYHAFWTYTILHKYTDTYWKNDTDQHKLQYTYFLSTSLLLINSCFNPVAVYCTKPAFREKFKSYLTCSNKTNSPPTVLEFVRRN